MPPALTILTFHTLADDGAVISFPPALFERLIAVLHGGYQVLQLEDAAARLRSGTALPQRAVAITFDDGYRSVYDVAFPILRHHGMPATVFLAVGDPEEPGWPKPSDPAARLPSMMGRAMLSWGEIAAMQQGGIRFGAHTLTHPDLTTLPPERIEREMATCKAILEEALGVPAVSFAYPFGRSDARSRELARRHYACAVTDRLGFAGPGSDLHALPRLDGYYLRHARLVEAFGTAWFPWYIRACILPRSARRGVQRVMRWPLLRGAA